MSLLCPVTKARQAPQLPNLLGQQLAELLALTDQSQQMWSFCFVLYPLPKL